MKTNRETFKNLEDCLAREKELVEQKIGFEASHNPVTKEYWIEMPK